MNHDWSSVVVNQDGINVDKKCFESSKCSAARREDVLNHNHNADQSVEIKFLIKVLIKGEIKLNTEN